MRRRDLIRALMATPMASWLRPLIPRAVALAVVPGPNAADVYRTAFAWANTLHSDEHDRLRGYATISLEDHGVRVLLERAGPTLRALREGASLAECRWGTETFTSEELGEGHLDVHGVNAVRLACLSARRLASDGQRREALDDLFAGLALAHRVGTGGVLFARLLECAGEVAVFETIGRLLHDLGPATLDDLVRRLDSLPAPEPASSTIGPESRFIVAVLRSQFEVCGPELGEEDWEKVDLTPREIETLQRLVGNDRAALIAHLDAMGPAFADLAHRLDLPRPGYHAALDEFVKSRGQSDPIVTGLVDAIIGVRHMVDRMRALRRMTRAGIALVSGGESEFLKVADPFGEGPFKLERRGNGFLIRSAMIDEGKPEVALAIGDVP